MTGSTATAAKTSLGRWIGFGVWDLAVVLSFVLIGRDTHEESVGLSEVLRTAAPFLLALVGAWLTPLVHREPWRTRTGVAVGLIATLVGLFFRGVVFGEGVSGAFPVVTAAYLVGLTVLGRVLFRFWTVAKAG